jgi:hypothetical protein
MKSINTILFLIILISFIVRSISINNLPPSLNWDEVSHGYNAYSILKAGKDEWGIKSPFIFRAFGDYKLPVYIYLTILPVIFFGLNPLSVRFISIIAGSLLPLIIYLIVNKILQKKSILPLLAASIITFSPGFIFLSRVALEANLFLTLFCISLYLILIKKYGLSTFFYALCLLTYNSSRVLLPFYIILIIYTLIKNKFKFYNKFFIFLPFILVVSITIFQSLNSSGQARYKWVSLLDSGSINKINELRQTYPRLIVNKVTYFSYTAFNNYLSHFNPKYIFIKGASNYQFNIPDYYLISPLFYIFFILGLIKSIKNIKKYEIKLLLYWLFVSPIPSSITRDAPHVLRSITLLPVVVIMIILGFDYLNSKYLKYSVVYIICVLTIGQYIFWPKYSQYAKKYSSAWQYGYKEIVSILKENYSKYDYIYITKKYGEPHEFILFYWPWDPQKYHQDQNKNWDYHANWYWVNGFDKFTFINDWEVLEKTTNPISKTLLITSPGNYNQSNFKKIKSINFLDNTPAFDVVEYE